MKETTKTSASNFENLDLACAWAGQKIAESTAKELEKLVTNALAVLEEQGVYAMFLYLKSRGGDEGARMIRDFYDFLRKTPRQDPLVSGNERDILKVVREDWAEDLDKLLFVRDLLRQSLVYARYHAKAREEGDKNEGNKEAS